MYIYIYAYIHAQAHAYAYDDNCECRKDMKTCLKLDYLLQCFQHMYTYPYATFILRSRKRSRSIEATVQKGTEAQNRVAWCTAAAPVVTDGGLAQATRSKTQQITRIRHVNVRNKNASKLCRRLHCGSSMYVYIARVLGRSSRSTPREKLRKKKI